MEKIKYLEKRKVLKWELLKIITALNDILEYELAGVECYTHYVLMVYGYNRILIVGWLHEQATESLMHAN